jgi:gamma-glutamyl-gamma-aminobutyrate hydrolase PuuD
MEHPGSPKRPRIGITTGFDYPVDEYEAAVHAAGGEPQRLTPDDPRGAALLDALDGIVFAGGDDVDPARYGATPHPKTERPSPERDAFEIALMRDAFARDLPSLAICRGVQIANVAFGGTLHQHVPDAFGMMIPHQPQVEGRTYRGVIDAHRVAVDVPSRLADLAGASIVTGSRHHQALDRIADPFRVVARAPDGVVEAIEPVVPHRFWLGVQWHPESTTRVDTGASMAIFKGLIAAARAK